MEHNYKLPEFLKPRKNNLKDIPDNIGYLLEKSKDEDTLIFYFRYGSYFGGTCEFLIKINNDENCQVVAEGSNGYTLYWNFEISIEKLKSLEKVVQPARKWLRNYETQQKIYDGYGWKLIFIGKNYKINTEGYEANPSNYFKVGNKILKVLNKIHLENTTDKDKVMLPINGYKYESIFVE